MIKDKLIHFISALLAIGVQKCTSSAEIRIVKMINSQCLMGTLIFSIYLTNNLIIHPETQNQGFLVICFFGFIFTVFLNSRAQFSSAKLLFLAICNSSLFYYSAIFGRNSLLYLLFIPLFSTPFIIFSDGKKTSGFWSYFSLTISAVCFIYLANLEVPWDLSFSAKFLKNIQWISLINLIIAAVFQQLFWITILHTTEQEVVTATKLSEKNTKQLLAKEIELTQQLASSKTRIEIAMQVLKFGVWEWNYATNELYWDDHMYSVLGLSKETYPNPTITLEKAMLENDGAFIKNELQNAFKEKKDFSSEFKIIRTDGAERTIRTEAKCFYDSSGKIIKLVGANWDITDARQQELKMIQHSKMSSLGEMSAGIAHEINNPLAIISAHAQRLTRFLSAPELNTDALRKSAEQIESTVGRIAKIVKGLKAFARDGEKDPFQNTSIKKIVDETLDFCLSRFNNNQIILTQKNILESLVLDCNASQISQVLLNLLNNAYDAVSSLEEKWVILEAADLGTFIEISVTDSGPGIPKDLQAKIMQPFFTTKPIGQGTGMGLSINNGIVASHRGTFGVDPECKNTKFFIRLPKIQA